MRKPGNVNQHQLNMTEHTIALHLFLVHLTTLYQQEPTGKMSVNCKLCGWKLPWPILMRHPSICLQELKKLAKNLNQDSWFPGQDLIRIF